MSRRTRPFPQVPGPCHPVGRRFTDLDSIIHQYVEEHRDGAARELDIFRHLPSLRRCIRQAGLARRRDGSRWKRLDHQRRIPSNTLRAWAKALLRQNAQMRSCRTFEALFNILEKESRKFWRNGELIVYDTALRIGAYLRLNPQKIYLHRGTREGAKALGIDAGRRCILPQELPKSLRHLKPYEIEDCLCIYKDQLRWLQLDERTEE